MALAPSWGPYLMPSLLLQKPREECRRPARASLATTILSLGGGSREELPKGHWEVDRVWATPSPDSDHWGLPSPGACLSDTPLFPSRWPQVEVDASRAQPSMTASLWFSLAHLRPVSFSKRTLRNTAKKQEGNQNRKFQTYYVAQLTKSKFCNPRKLIHFFLLRAVVIIPKIHPESPHFSHHRHPPG